MKSLCLLVFNAMFVSVLLYNVVPSKALSQQPSATQTTVADSSPPQSYTAEMLQKFFRTEAITYDIAIANSNKRLDMQEQPLINWQNPEKILNQGSLYIWMEGTRPAVIVSVFSFVVKDQARRKHEAISLSPHSLVAKLDGDVVWSPEPADLEGVHVAEDLEIGSSESRRLIQLRTIARDVSGNHYSQEGVKRELRLMPQPLIRYQSEQDGIIDGALFALSIGTDPEIVFQVEARKEGSNNRWYVVPFRSNFDKLDLSYRGKQIWAAPLVPELMYSKALQMPFAAKAFFVFYPKNPLPPPR